MVRLGICTSIDNIMLLQEMGYDYLEAGLASVAAMDEDDFHMAALHVDRADIKVESFNGMMPGDIKLTGPDVNAQKIHDYLDLAFTRARRLGGKVVVFGSGAARGVPADFPMDVAWRQIMNFLRIAEKHAMEHDITIAIEPLRRAECNIINLVSEATALSAIAQLPHIRVLGDTYHMAMTNEPYTSLTLAGELLAHVHIANPLGRVYPAEGDGEDYAALFATLNGIGYTGRVSIEGACKNLEEDGRNAFKVLDAARKSV